MLKILSLRCVLFALVFTCTHSVYSQPPDTLWTYTYATSANDEAWAIASTSDGGLFIGGSGLNADSVESALLICLDRGGHQRWVRDFALGDNIKDIITTSDGGLAFTGGRYIIKTDFAGIEEWVRPLSLYLGLGSVSIAETVDSGFVILSVGDAIASAYCYLTRLSSTGDSLWSRTLGERASYFGGCVLPTLDGGYFVAGARDWQANVVKTDSSGIVLWSNSFGSPSLGARLYDAATLSNGNFVVVGTQGRGNFTYDPIAAQVTASGDTVWTKIYSYLGPAWFNSIAVLPDGNLFVGGTTGLDYLTVLLSPEGDTLWTARYGTPLFDRGNAMCLTPDGGIAMAGEKHTISSNTDIWVVRTGSLLDATDFSYRPVQCFKLLQNYPNPFNGTTYINFFVDHSLMIDYTVYDITGRTVKDNECVYVNAGYNQIILNANTWPSGNYFYTFQSMNQKLVGKMILLK